MERAAHLQARGRAIAAVLRGAWRAVPEPVGDLNQAVSAASETLLGTGCGALAWWRIRNSPLVNEAGPAPLREAFRLHTLQAAVHTKTLEHVLAHFNAGGLIPMVFKGWTMARLYASPGLRPYGDVDVLVDSGDEARARDAIASLPPEIRGLVDLDMRVLRRFLPDRSFAELAERCTTEKVGNAKLRILAPEDHLRLICLHQLDHGGWRPLWLCDVAAFVEALPKEFSWQALLAGNAHLSDAVVALIGLAEELLGAQLPAKTPRASVPSWFRKALLQAWGGGFQAPPDSLLKLRQIGWRRAAVAMRARWPDPVTSTLHLRAPLRGIPRPLLQVTECGRRALLFARKNWRAGSSRSESGPVAADEGVRS
jgi:Uncharacterised nucleotidyltransferase